MSLLMGTARTVLVAAGAVLGLVLATRLEPAAEIGYRAVVDIEAPLPQTLPDDFPGDVTLVRGETTATLEAIGESADTAVSRALAAAYGLLLTRPVEAVGAETAPRLDPRPAPSPAAASADDSDLAERLDALRALEEATATLRRLGENADPEALAGTGGLPPAVESAAARWVEASIEAADAELIYGPRHPSRTAAVNRMQSAAARLLATAAAARADAEEVRRIARERLEALDRRERASAPLPVEPAASRPSSAETDRPAPSAPLPLLAARVEPIRAATALPYGPAGAAAGAIVAFLLSGLVLRGSRRETPPRHGAQSGSEAAPREAERRDGPPAPRDTPAAAVPVPVHDPEPEPEPARGVVSLDGVWDRLADALEAGERVRILVRADAVDAAGQAAVVCLAQAAIATERRVLIVDADPDGRLMQAFGLPHGERAPWHLVDLSPALEARLICLPHVTEREAGDAWRAEHARCMLRLVETTFDVVVVAMATEPDALAIARFADDCAVIGLTETEPDAPRRAA